MIASLFDLTLCLLILAVAGAAVFGRAAFMAVVFLHRLRHPHRHRLVAAGRH